MADWIDHNTVPDHNPVPDHNTVPEDDMEPKNLDLIYGASTSVLQIELGPEPPNQRGKDLMSKFFIKFDEDDSGLLDVDEIMAGIEKFAEAMDLDFDSRKIAALFEELDEDGNQELDREEFTVFLQKYAEYQDIGMEDLAYTMATMHDEEMSAVVSSKPKKQQSVFLRTLFSAVVFQGQQQTKKPENVTPTAVEEENKSKKNGDTRLSGFFRRITVGTPKEDSQDDVTESPTATKPTHEVVDHDLSSIMWDVDTSENKVDVFSAEGLKDYYGNRGGH